MTSLSIIVLTSFYYILKPKVTLPIFSPNMVSSELVEDSIHHVKKYHKISNFSLTNQNGETVTEENYNNKIYVADFFFTTCPSICPIMTENMFYIQEKTVNKDAVRSTSVGDRMHINDELYLVDNVGFRKINNN